jgi:hypothetical protein
VTAHNCPGLQLSQLHVAEVSVSRIGGNNNLVRTALFSHFYFNFFGQICLIHIFSILFQFVSHRWLMLQKHNTHKILEFHKVKRYQGEKSETLPGSLGSFRPATKRETENLWQISIGRRYNREKKGITERGNQYTKVPQIKMIRSKPPIKEKKTITSRKTFRVG